MAGYILIDVGHGDVQRVFDRLLQHPNATRPPLLAPPTSSPSSRPTLGVVSSPSSIVTSEVEIDDR